MIKLAENSFDNTLFCLMGQGIFLGRGNYSNESASFTPNAADYLKLNFMNY